MTLPGYLALTLLLTAFSWTVLLAAEGRSWGERGLSVALGLVAIAQLLPLVSEVEVWDLSPMGAGAWSDVGSATIAALTVVLLDRVLRRTHALQTRIGGQLQYLTDLFEAADEAIVLLDGDGKLFRSNRAFGAMFGYSRGEVPEGTLDQFLVEDDRVEDIQILTRRILSGEQVTRTTVCRRRDGRKVDVSMVGGPVRIAEIPARGYVLFRDITRMMEVEGTFRHFEKALEQTQVGVTITDLNGMIIYTNPADAAMHGYSVEELIGQDVRLFAPTTLSRPLSVMQLEDLGRWGRETLNVRKDGEVFPVQLLSDVVRNASDEPIGVVTTCLDITDRKRAEQALRDSEARYALALRGASEGLWDWNLETNEVYFSSLWQSMLGFEEGEVGSSIDDWLSRVHEEDLGRLEESLEVHRRGETPRMEVEHRVKCKDGMVRWFLARGIAERGPDGVPYRIAGSLTDVTERKEVEQGLARDALYDGLTGLPNRTFFMDLLERTHGQLKRRDEFTFAILFMDLDRFKLVNDTFGHAAGDDLLIEVARRVQDTIRPGDIVARFGGDEFCILLDDLQGSRDATRVARRIQEALIVPCQVQGREVTVSASIGIAISEKDLPNGETLMRNADIAMYRSKGRGDSTVEVFDLGMHEQAMDLLALEADLRAALAADQLELHYQPVVHMGDEEWVGLEVLLRWTHPERGPVSPSEFIGLAEDTGLLVPIGRWVLKEACRQFSEWQKQFPGLNGTQVSVNVSLKQLQQPNFLVEIKDVLEKTGLKPESLQLEISEQIIMTDAEYHADLIRRLRELGVLIQLDEFGTGPTSLVYLERLRVDSVKIDRTFIGSIGTPGGRDDMVQSMIALARGLDIHVTATGVETAEQAARLMKLDCERGQGFLFSTPLTPPAVSALLEKRG